MSLTENFAPQIPAREATVVVQEGGGIFKFNELWYNFFVFLSGLTAKAVEQLTVGASPYVYEATSIGSLHVEAGTVSSVILQRGGVSLACPTSGFIPVAAGDVVTVEYTVVPTVTFVPAART